MKKDAFKQQRRLPEDHDRKTLTLDEIEERVQKITKGLFAKSHKPLAGYTTKSG